MEKEPLSLEEVEKRIEEIRQRLKDYDDGIYSPQETFMGIQYEMNKP